MGKKESREAKRAREPMEPILSTGTRRRILNLSDDNDNDSDSDFLGLPDLDLESPSSVTVTTDEDSTDEDESDDEDDNEAVRIDLSNPREMHRAMRQFLINS